MADEERKANKKALYAGKPKARKPVMPPIAGDPGNQLYCTLSFFQNKILKESRQYLKRNNLVRR
jgi:hypothetical protein